MRVRRQPGPVLVFLLALAAVTAATPALARRNFSNCYAQLEGVTPDRGGRVECTDGDPSCDHDGACNGTCEFLVRMCVNRCVTPLVIERLRVTGVELELPPLPSRAGACGGYSIVTAPALSGTERGRARRRARRGTIVALTARAPDGFKLTRDRLAFVCRARADACPLLPEVKEDTVAETPALTVDPPSPAAGTPATVRVDFPGGTDITVVATGEACGGFAMHGPSPSPLVVTRPVGEFGGCDLMATMNTPAGSQTLRARFQVTPTTLVLPALDVPDALYLPGALPVQSGTPDDPIIASINAPGSIINGGSVQLRVGLADPTRAVDVRRVQVEVAGAGGYTGYFEAPATLAGDKLTINTTLSNAFTPGPGTVDVAVQVVDRFGNVGNRLIHSFGVVQVGSGIVQVSLSWDTPTDVDLHVVEPDGTEIYYGRTTSPSGGTLDLDSNAACSIDGVNNENITWAGTPPEGEYVVRVDFWSDCGGQPANYVATVRACGEVRTFSGAFAPGSDDAGGAGSGRTVARFDTRCETRVRGKATYEDFPQTLGGLGAVSTMLPIRFAEVAVKRAADDVTLAQGETEQDGTFDLRFTNPGSTIYYLDVTTAGNTIPQHVADDRDRVYTARSATIDAAAEPDKTDLIVAAAADAAGPAFNIFDAGIDAGLLVAEVHGVQPPPLTWLWTRGKKGLCVGDTSCYATAVNTISVLSIPADRDEYDDLVLLHQYGHFYQSVFSRTDSPGGSAAAQSYVDPRLAFAEGSATFFGSAAKGTSIYLDTNASGLRARVDIDSLAPAIPLGTSTDTATGDLSAAVVAAVLHDLFDSTNEPKDTLTRRGAVFNALAYLRAPAFVDRGVAGADLVDALDGWFCLGYGARGDASSGVEGNSVGMHRFPYDFASLPTCR